MANDKKDNKVDPGTKQDSQGEHGGNRGGDHGQDPDEPGKSSRAAGKDPHRGED